LIFHSTVWQGLEEKLKGLSFTKGQSRAFNRMFFSGAQEIDVDGQGRVSVPDYLKEFAKIDRDIMIIGVADRIEVWGKKAWNDYYTQNAGKFEETAEGLFD
jgi:MraZ protein